MDRQRNGQTEGQTESEQGGWRENDFAVLASSNPEATPISQRACVVGGKYLSLSCNPPYNTPHNKQM
jgi:hypothetical protein